MILVDLSQTMFSVMFQNLKTGFSKDLARSMIFMTLLSFKKKFEAEYGEMVLAIDSRCGYWRKDIFPYYKAHRADARAESDINWDEVFDVVNSVTEELKECIPWRCIQVDKAEADDVIAVLASAFGNDVPVLILSSDKDYAQLQKYRKVVQYSPIMKKWIKIDDPKRFLSDMILTGDSGDGIPNVRSPENAIVEKIRQLPVTSKMKEEFYRMPEKLYALYKDRILMNQRLIDFEEIPSNIRDLILQEYNKPIRGSINKLYKLFVSTRLSRALGDIEQFKIRNPTNAIHSEIGFFQ
jgi:5'-3' exonuclease